jgi:hypothetical protein
MCKYLLSICNNFILNKLTLYFSSIVTILFAKYPFLYKAVDYIFTIRDIFNLYITTLFSKPQSGLENKYPVIYAIIVYLYSEYIAIMKGELTKNVLLIITLYVIAIVTLILFYLYYYYIIHYLNNTWLKNT